ncbi:hypothetical protein ABZZ85_23540, partial [Streptomyces halstedii]
RPDLIIAVYSEIDQAAYDIRYAVPPHASPTGRGRPATRRAPSRETAPRPARRAAGRGCRRARRRLIFRSGM